MPDRLELMRANMGISIAIDKTAVALLMRDLSIISTHFILGSDQRYAKNKTVDISIRSPY
jgi:hypothetical protein